MLAAAAEIHSCAVFHWYWGLKLSNLGESQVTRMTGPHQDWQSYGFGGQRIWFLGMGRGLGP